METSWLWMMTPRSSLLSEDAGEYQDLKAVNAEEAVRVAAGLSGRFTCC